MGHTQNTARKSCYLAGQLLLKPWRNKKPRTHVLRLLLTPDNIYNRRNFISVQRVNVYTTYYTHKNTQYVCVCTYIHIPYMLSIYVYIHTYTYIYAHTYKHTHISSIHTFLIWHSVIFFFFEKCIVIYPSPSPHHHNDIEQSSQSQISPHSVLYTQLFLPPLASSNHWSFLYPQSSAFSRSSR